MISVYFDLSSDCTSVKNDCTRFLDLHGFSIEMLWVLNPGIKLTDFGKNGSSKQAKVALANILKICPL